MFPNRNKRLTGAKPTECPACHGIGYTPQSAADMETRDDTVMRMVRRGCDYRLMAFTETHEIKTLKQGSGCIRCGGKGQVTPNDSQRQSRVGPAAAHR